MGCRGVWREGELWRGKGIALTQQHEPLGVAPSQCLLLVAVAPCSRSDSRALPLSRLAERRPHALSAICLFS